jgi:hypothetical protein
MIIYNINNMPPKKLEENIKMPKTDHITKMNIYDGARVARAKTEKIYLLNRNIDDTSATFDVMGSRGIPYKVTLSGVPDCTCPDCSTRHNRCKHILFILIRIFKLEDPYKKKFTDEEITNYIKLYKQNIQDLSSKYKNLGNEISVDNGPLCLDDACAICLDDLDTEEYIWCKKYCRRCVHKACFLMCKRNKPDIKCVYCQKEFVYL